jgi:hypothetical protein
MGWIISVGKAGAKGRAGSAQAVSLRMDVQGMAAQVRIYPAAGQMASDAADALPVWQAQRVWQNVLTTLVGH